MPWLDSSKSKEKISMMMIISLERSGMRSSTRDGWRAYHETDLDSMKTRTPVERTRVKTDAILRRSILDFAARMSINDHLVIHPVH